MASSEVSEVFTSFEDGLRGDNGSTVDVVSVNDHSSLAQIEIDSGGHSGSLGHRLDIMNQVENLLKSIYILCTRNAIPNSESIILNNADGLYQSLQFLLFRKLSALSLTMKMIAMMTKLTLEGTVL